MSSKNPCLSDDKHGYDLVISTTQASINAGLLTYLGEGSHPEEFICLLVNPKSGKPSIQVSLNDLLRRTNGVNPFEIPTGTSHKDPRIQALTKALFGVGIHLRVGIPSGIQPFDLPPVITLGNSVNDVDFNLFFSKFTIVQNIPPMWGQKGSWDVWHQPLVEKEPWHIRMRVGIVEDDISNQLDTTYFKQHPDARDQVKKQLQGVSPTSSFNFRQLVFDVDNAVTPPSPVLKGIPRDSNAYAVFQSPLFNVARHCPSVKTISLPPVSVVVVTTSSGPSPFHPTGYDLQISHPPDDMGMMRRETARLNYLCATSHHPLQSCPGIGWIWGEPGQLSLDGDMIAVNRNLIGKYIMDKILPQAKKYCIKPRCRVTVDEHGTSHYSTGMSPGQTPQIATITHTGAEVIQIEYHAHATSYGGGGAQVNTELRINTSYTCNIGFIGSTVVIKQHLLYVVYMRRNHTSNSINALDHTITDIYVVDTDETGSLKIVKGNSSTEDHSESPNKGASVDFFRQISQVTHGLGIGSLNFNAMSFEAIPLSQVQNFIFPGANKFVFTSASFSQHQDLICGTAQLQPTGTASRISMSDATAETYASNQAISLSPKPPRSHLSLTHSADMMENRIHGRMLSPFLKLEALQMDDGHALLFAIDKDSRFYSFTEKSGENRTGWEARDHTPNSSPQDAPSTQDPSGVVHTFDVGQSPSTGTISLAIAVSIGNTDVLYVSLNNSSSTTSWISNIQWTEVPFSVQDEEAPPSVSIAGIMFAETTGLGSHEHLVIDLESPGEIIRYHINQEAPESRSRWVRERVPIDVNDGNYQSCVGRPANSKTDGIYTTGTGRSESLMIFVPVIDRLGPPSPETLSFKLPGGRAPTAIAPIRNIDRESRGFGTTDLYAVVGSTLWRYAADAQENNAEPQPVFESEILSGTRHLVGMVHEGVTTLWGRNDAGEVYYSSRKTAGTGQSEEWTEPLPLLVDIERISAYVNKSDGGNTIFAADKGRLVKLIQATDTDEKMWKTQDIMIEAEPQEESIPFNSFTTLVKVKNENNVPVPNTKLSISANTRTAVYINGIYYVIGKTPMQILTDITGSLTIIETTDDIHCAIIQVSVENTDQVTVINPMQNIFNRLQEFETEESLRNIKIPKRFVAGGFWDSDGTESLITDEDPNVVRKVAQNVANLRMAYLDALNAKPQSSRVLKTSGDLYSLWDEIKHGAGDLLQAAKKGASSIVDFVKDKASKLWNITIKIGKKIWSGILITSKAMLSAVTIAWNKLKKEVQTIISSIQQLFHWDDIKRTKDVMTNMTKLYFEYQVDKISEVKASFDQDIQSVRADVQKWADNKGATEMDEMSKPASNSGSNPAEASTPSSQFLADHFKNNADKVEVNNVPVGATSELFDKLMEALDGERMVLGDAYESLKKLALEGFKSKSVGEFVTELIDILKDAVLGSAKVVVDALLNVLTTLGKVAIQLLSAKLHIPVISDILNALGVEDISFLDLFMWIAAVGYTVVYKIAENNPPFPDDDNSKFIINARKLEDLQGSPSWHSADTRGPTSDEMAVPSPGAFMPDAVKTTIYVAGHSIAGFILFNCSFVTTFEAVIPADNNPFGLTSAVLGIISGAAQGGADFLSPRDPIENRIVRRLSTATTCITILIKCIFSGLGQNLISKTPAKNFGVVENSRGIGAIFNSVLVIPAIICTGYHFKELSQKDKGAVRSAAILGETTNMTQYVSRIAYASAVNFKPTVEVAIPTIAAANLAGAMLQTAEAIVSRSDSEAQQ